MAYSTLVKEGPVFHHKVFLNPCEFGHQSQQISGTLHGAISDMHSLPPPPLPCWQESKGFMDWVLSKTIRDVDVLGAGYEVGPRGLHSFTSQLNLSAFHGIGGARRGCVAFVKGALVDV
jgi:hypothetical protein